MHDVPHVAPASVTFTRIHAVFKSDPESLYLIPI